MRRFIFVLIAALFSLSALSANDVVAVANDSTKVVKSKSSRFLPTRQRIDRNIDRNKFVYKGEYMLGLTDSYGNISSQDADIMLLLDNLDLRLRTATIKPFFAYS